MTQIQSRLRRYITRLGLLPAAFFVWRGVREWSPDLVRRNRRSRKLSRLPVPPNSLIFSSTATREVDWFLNSGVETAGAFRAALTKIGRPIESFQRVLDFGCGSGRVLRQWEGVIGPTFFGTDYNERSVNWVRQNLNFVNARKNLLEPSLPFDDGFFDLCYSVSVFTHLPENLQRPWVEELHRVLADNAILMLTLSGHGDFGRLTASERDEFEGGSLVVVDGSLAGTNMCGAYHPEEYVRKNWSDLFTILEVYPSGAKGCPNQDLFVFRRVS